MSTTTDDGLVESKARKAEWAHREYLEALKTSMRALFNSGFELLDSDNPDRFAAWGEVRAEAAIRARQAEESSP